LIDLGPIIRRTILARLRRARLLAEEDPHYPGHLDTHPLVREYSGEQQRSQRSDALGLMLFYAACLSVFERNPAEAARIASNMIELSARQGFALWLAAGTIFRGWARSVSGDATEGISLIEEGLKKYACDQHDVKHAISAGPKG